jgi:hypothetical protein
MGLLDEAIREHLELKRRRGADATEIARQEQEALGPARRGPAPLELPPEGEGGIETRELDESGFPDGELPAETEAQPASNGSERRGLAPEAAPEFHEPEPHEPPLDEPELHQPPAPEAPEHLDSPTQPFSAFEHDEQAPLPEEEPHPASSGSGEAPPAPQPAPPEQGPPSEHKDADAATGTEGEDVLEETPEFLQETPEHDRLWFEQRPPRDFDFDK